METLLAKDYQKNIELSMVDVKRIKRLLPSKFEAIEHIKSQKHNPNYLTSVEFRPEQLVLTSDINEIVKYADVLIFAIPSAFLVGELEKLNSSLQEKIIFSARQRGDHFCCRFL